MESNLKEYLQCRYICNHDTGSRDVHFHTMDGNAMPNNHEDPMTDTI